MAKILGIAIGLLERFLAWDFPVIPYLDLKFSVDLSLSSLWSIQVLQ